MKYILPYCISLLVLFGCGQKDQTSPGLDTIQRRLESELTAQHLDSLYYLALELPNDSFRIDLLLKIYRKTIKVRPIRYDILDTAISLSKEINYTQGLALAYDRKGLNYRYEQLYRKAVKYHKLALKKYRFTKDTVGTIKCLNNLGVALRRMNSEKEAMNYYLEALKLARTKHDDRSIAVALNGIGNVFVNIGQYDRALPYFREGLSIETKNNNKKGINYDMSNIGEVHMFKGDYDSALVYYTLALNISKELNYKDNVSVNYNCIALLYQKKENYLLSNKYYHLALPKLIKFRGQRYLANTYINLAVNFTHLHQFDSAEYYVSKGLKIAEEIQSPENIVLAYQTLAEVQRAKNQHEDALRTYKKAISKRDSINNVETKRSIAALESIYLSEIKDNKIRQYKYESQNQKTKSFGLMLVISLLLIVLVILIVTIQLKRRNNSLLITQMEYEIQQYLEKIRAYEAKPPIKDDKTEFDLQINQFGLTERESDVLWLISQGLKNEEIAEKLFLSVSTVKTHTRNIFVKLDVRNRIEAARKAHAI